MHGLRKPGKGIEKKVPGGPKSFTISGTKLQMHLKVVHKISAQHIC